METIEIINIIIAVSILLSVIVGYYMGRQQNIEERKKLYNNNDILENENKILKEEIKKLNTKLQIKILENE